MGGGRIKNNMKTYWYGEGNNSTINIVFIPNDNYYETTTTTTHSNNIIVFGSIVDEEKNEVHRIGRNSHGHFFMETTPTHLYPDSIYSRSSSSRIPPIMKTQKNESSINIDIIDTT